jgi:TolB protein
MNGDGTDPRRLTYTSYDEASPTWSPDGTQIAFQVKRRGKWELAIMDADGSHMGYLPTSRGDAAESPVWQPYCDWIVFQGLAAGDWDLYGIRSDGSYSMRLVYTPYAHDVVDELVLHY